MTVDVANIQANIVRGSHHWKECRYIFYQVANLERAAAALARVRAWMHNGSKPPVAPRVNVNLAFTHIGLRSLKVEYDARDRYRRRFQGRNTTGAGETTSERDPDRVFAFEAGMRAAAERLDDAWPRRVGEHHEWPDGTVARPWWVDEGGEPWTDAIDDQPHMMVWLSARRADDAETSFLDPAHEEISEALNGAFVEVGFQNAAALTKDFRGHFGFRDGLSQPAIRGARAGSPGDGKISVGGWEPLEPGEFILGHRDEGHQTLPLPKPESVTRDGTFLVYRKLYQDVAAYRSFVRKHGNTWDWRDSEIGAKLVGRRQDGTPLVQAPGARGPNDFRYGEDPDGFECPIGSHVRRANPRDALHYLGRLVNRHRMIRRGMPYGEELPDHAEDDGADRGLIFIAFNARIEDQFEFVQRAWLNGGRAFRIGDDPDVLAGNANPDRGPSEARVVINGRPPVLAKSRPFVRFRGGEYFFVPSFTGLAAMIDELPR